MKTEYRHTQAIIAILNNIAIRIALTLYPRHPLPLKLEMVL